MKPGGANNPEGRNQYSKDDEDNVSNTHNDQTKRDPEYNSNTGLLRRLAKQGRDDLLDRVASGESRAIAHGAGGDCEGD